ncbi:ubiquitin-like modifier-activating enzyme ATG7 [Chironomus tepperi]|uniref:ubiquitin-like modifier-activating enzyme ATG7 n=1 Tax=Chironomus tepperi TaxID=113505 RepID=UPI00391F3A3D
MSENKIFQYVEFKSVVAPDFWYKLAENKLNVDKLEENEKTISGSYTNLNAKSCLIDFDCTSFNSKSSSIRNQFGAIGILKNLNTIESFKNCDKLALLNKAGKQLIANILNGTCLEDPRELACFLLLSFADLKKYNFYYWFAFPASLDIILYEASSSQFLYDKFSDEEINNFTLKYDALDTKQSAFFVANQFLDIILLKDAISHDKIENNLLNFDISTIYFCFSDPSENKECGWILRNYVLLLYILCPSLHGRTINILSVSQSEQNSLKASRIFYVTIPKYDKDLKFEKWTGWEKNNNGKLLPRIANMGDVMDPIKTAEHFALLNLKLMKWRLLPNLNLDIIRTQKCLLFGAGTLGCGIARSLMSWGFTNISFIDSGHVSYSNPVRQSLFTYADASQNKFKSKAASERLLEILPSVTSKGHVFQIPMPGHPVSDSSMQKTLEDVDTLVNLIKESDVLFLVTDSRESRWLPTILGSYYGKIVITVALGFESYLVMRHGASKGNKVDEQDEEVSGLKCIPGHKLGCYFCNDITSPGNSIRDRTLDQQCTVTRPAVSNIAASISVELLVSLLQDERKHFAPAYYQLSNKNNEAVQSIPESILGIIPHSIRGYLSTYSHILPATERFNQCIACSDFVLNEYKEHDKEFLLKVFNSAEYLEKITNLEEFANLDNDILNELDDDFDSS